MASKNLDSGSSLVLGFALFIVGFLTGILAIAIVGLSSDITTIGAIIFALGFVLGIIAAVLALAVARRRRKAASSRAVQDQKLIST